MSKKVALSIVILAAFSVFAVSGTVYGQSPLLPKKLAIYYGFPSLVNGSQGNRVIATDVFNDYDIVVFGDGLQDPGHPDHLNTAAIISSLRTLPNKTDVYGYIPISVKNFVPGQISLTIAEIQGRVNDWAAMGVAGIFLDQAGYDFCVSRERQNAIVGYIGLLSVFINAFNPDDVFSSAVTGNQGCDEQMNPEIGTTGIGTPTLLGPNDIYLHESFQIILSEFQDPAFWVNKSDKALNYKNQFGTQMATVTTVSESDPGFDQSKFDYTRWSTLLYGFDAMGWGEIFFSAADNSLPFRTRPDPGDIGSAFTSWAVTHAGDVHTRTTTAGTIDVDTAAHTGKFTPEVPLSVITPNGGEIWRIGNTQTIRWMPSGISGNVRIQISRNGGAWGNIVTKTPNDGSQSWSVTKPATTRARLRVCRIASPVVCGPSSADFRIQ